LFYIFGAFRTYLHNKAAPDESTYHNPCEYKPKRKVQERQTTSFYKIGLDYITPEAKWTGARYAFAG
jgi:hypothetical protein